ncbi:hypothetical protein MMC07_003546 [Pseudocyphellaria aurata]|nr:hypothetical protein [Pseudocyphellaria aurata]
MAEFPMELSHSIVSFSSPQDFIRFNGTIRLPREKILSSPYSPRLHGNLLPLNSVAALQWDHSIATREDRILWAGGRTSFNGTIRLPHENIASCLYKQPNNSGLFGNLLPLNSVAALQWDHSIATREDRILFVQVAFQLWADRDNSTAELDMYSDDFASHCLDGRAGEHLSTGPFDCHTRISHPVSALQWDHSIATREDRILFVQVAFQLWADRDNSTAELDMYSDDFASHCLDGRAGERK